MLGRLLLRLLVPPREREFFLGDLDESGRRAGFREVAAAAALRVARNPRRRVGGRAVFLAQQVASDIRHAMRRIARTPASALTALAALSIGIGLSAVMFSLIGSGVLPTLPFDAGDRIVRVQREEFAPITAEAYAYWQERQRSFDGLGGWFERPVNLSVAGGQSAPVYSAALDPVAFPLLSVEPVLGRAFTEEDAAPGSPAVVLLGWETWRRELNADPAVVGRTVRVNGEPAEIVGVMPEGFGFPWNQELWMPLRLDVLRPGNNPAGISVFGVLRAGASMDVAAAELNDLDAQRPRPTLEPDAPPVEVRAFTDIINPRGRSQVLAALMLSVALLVLLVACANATNVLLAQAVVRGREVAVRSALGASRMRIASQVWVEVSLLALAGAAGGVLLAVAGVRAVRSAAPTPGMPFWFDLRVDGSVLVFVVAAAVLAAMLAGVLPALHAARANRQDLLKDVTRGTSSRRLGRVMGRLIGVEMAASFVLLVAAGLFIRSAVNLQTWEFPFDPEGVYTAHVRLPDGRYESAADRAQLVARLEARLAAIGGTSSTTLATALPGVGAALQSIAVQGVHDPAGTDLPRARHISVSPEFFELFRAPVLEGRGFDAGDGSGDLPVAIVNETFASAFLPAGAVGHRVAFPDGTGDPEWLTIVGVVPDLMPAGLERTDEEAVYRPLAQAVPGTFRLAVRSNASPEALNAPVRAAVADVDPDLALYFVSTLDRSIDAANSAFAWLSALFIVAGGLALFLAAVGLYGVMAFWVAQRTREIGVRMAIGGGRGSIVRLVLRQAMTQIVGGIVIGLLIAAPLAWLLRATLLDVRPFDPLVFGSVLGVLASAGVLGCALPALRATRVNPQAALAAE